MSSKTARTRETLFQKNQRANKKVFLKYATKEMTKLNITISIIETH